MKKLMLPFLVLFLALGCSTADDTTNTTTITLAAQDIFNAAYGTDAEQKIDIYLPEGRTPATKVIMLLHGGSWIAGSKEDLNDLVPVIKSRFPHHAIVNINYRLATDQSPAFPKQIEDIQKVVQHLKSSDYHLSDDYALIGFSAGAHLSMLYSYKYDTAHDVKAVCNVVGPADFTDIAYTTHPLYPYAALTLLGTAAPTQQMINQVNPIAHITPQSPPTIMFYGGQDPLIPSTQGPLLRDRLTEAGVYNEFNLYPEGGHGDWDAGITAEVYSKIIAFLQERL